MTRSKLIAFLLALYPVASIYKFPILINNLGHSILLFIIFPLALAEYLHLNSPKTKDLNKYILYSVYFIVASIVIPLVGGFNSDSRALLVFIEYSIILFIVINCIQQKNSTFYYYGLFAELFSWFLILQILLVPLGIHLSGFIPFLDFYFSDAEFTSVDEGRMLRAASVFTEPSHFALYVSPVLAYSLWKIKGTKTLRRIIVLSIALLLSGSGNGVILFALIYFIFIVHKYFTKRSFTLYVVGATILLAAIVYIPRTSFFQNVTYGLFVTEYDTTESRAEARVYRGFALFSQMDTREMITGIGWRNAGNYFSAKKPSLYNLFYMENFDYFNSIAGILIYGGVIGLILFLWFFLVLWKQVPFWGYRLLILVILVPMFSSSIFMMEQWPLYLFSLFSTKLYAKDLLIKEVV